MTSPPLAAFIVADVHLLRPEEGGRRSGIANGYRCNCWVGHVVDGKRTYNDATFYVLKTGGIEPGSTAQVRVRPHYPNDWTHLTVGSGFELCEGPRVVGHARITELFPSQ